MGLVARYRKLDYVDYFSRVTLVGNEDVRRFATEPKCLAVLDAFTSGRITLDVAAWYAADELEALFPHWKKRKRPVPKDPMIYPAMHLRVIRQAARCRELPTNDPRFVDVPQDIKQRFPEVYSLPYGAGRVFATLDQWRQEVHYRDFEADDSKIRMHLRDHDEYLFYWRLANRDILEEILSDTRVVSCIEAFRKRKDGTDLSYLTGELDRIIGHRIADLNGTWRYFLFCRIYGDINVGVVDMSDGIGT
jgi:hypothetical protein